jgi:hypothetical protein
LNILIHNITLLIVSKINWSSSFHDVSHVAGKTVGLHLEGLHLQGGIDISHWHDGLLAVEGSSGSTLAENELSGTARNVVKRAGKRVQTDILTFNAAVTQTLVCQSAKGNQTMSRRGIAGTSVRMQELNPVTQKEHRSGLGKDNLLKK